MPIKRVLPLWCKEVKKALIDKDMGVEDLAAAIKKSRYYVSAIINGRYINPELQQEISDFLELRVS